MWGGRVTESGIVGKEDLPEWLSSICKTLVHSNIFSEETTPNHVLVNRYDINSGIMPHRDGPLYYPKVAIISLESDTVFDFWEPYIHSDLIEEESDKDKPIFSLIVPRLSLLVFQDQCYTDLLHGISSRLVLMIIVQLVC
ncbi:AlkB [Cryptosporidium bovis]|uniref:AlkB n=1 Tax=Cryptosporidium bovis TaxID=310047 RepID=UPI00351A6728|nr:AlkB [Cryptosporidium bovis]